MATLVSPPPIADPIWRLSVEQYHAMIEGGILNEDSPVELVEGILLEKMPRNPLHRVVTEVIRAALTALVPAGWYVSAQDPITLSDGEPEPDVAVVKGRVQDYLNRHPQPADVALVIEVSDSTLPTDRGLKQRAYAHAGIPEYWVADLNGRRVEVRTEPQGAAYRTLAVYTFDNFIPVRIQGVEYRKIRLNDLVA
jgi:Uma2 family endonuclease